MALGDEALSIAPPAVKRTAPRILEYPFSESQARCYRTEYAQWAGLPEEFTNSLGMTFVLIPPGSFTMGSPDDEPGRNPGDYNEGPLHKVTLTSPFYLGKHEVTYGQFARFVKAQSYVTDGERTGGGNAHDEQADWKHRPGTHWRNPGFAGSFQQRDDHPVVHVSHTDALAFCQWLSDQPGGISERVMVANGAVRPQQQSADFNLPTEAQWEWGCRAGSSTAYWWGSDEETTGRRANVGDRSLLRMHPKWPRAVMPMDDGHPFLAPVGSYQPNAFGLHDMIGNVWEFCADHYGKYPAEAVTDPAERNPQRGFAVRGGGWSNAPQDVRSAVRNADPPHFCHSNLGFRVALTLAEFEPTQPEKVLAGLQEFYRKTARPDGSFQPGIDPEYRGISDSAYSDLAAITYAVTIHKTFGWKLPYEEQTRQFLLNRQKTNGDFFNVAGTVNPDSPEGRTYNTTQGLVALFALGTRPRHDPLPVFEAILKEDYKQLPAYSTSFFPLAYLCTGKPIPEKADLGIRALMVQDETGYTNDHIAATFHASHYYRLVGEETPKAQEMIARILRDQNANGSWLLNMPARDRHATFDAVFTLVHEGQNSNECAQAIRRAGHWALACRNPDGGFGHYPGSTSDADAIYFQVGTLVMAGMLPPVDPLPPHPELLSWGHLMPVVKTREKAFAASIRLPGWAAAVAFSPNGKSLAAAGADHSARLYETDRFQAGQVFPGHRDVVAAVQFHPAGDLIATGCFDHTAVIWDLTTGKIKHRLVGHKGAVLAVAFSPDKSTLATAGIDQTIQLSDVATGQRKSTLIGHKSWVSGLVYHPEGEWLASGSSDGTIKIWNPANSNPLKTLEATPAEVRSLAISPDGTELAAGMRYGKVKVWSTRDWQERLTVSGSGDTCSVAFHPTRKQFVTTEGDWNRGGTIKLRDLVDGKILKEFRHTGEILNLSFSPDGQFLAAAGADKTIRIWKLNPEQ